MANYPFPLLSIFFVKKREKITKTRGGEGDNEEELPNRTNTMPPTGAQIYRVVC